MEKLVAFIIGVGLLFGSVGGCMFGWPNITEKCLFLTTKKVL